MPAQLPRSAAFVVAGSTMVALLLGSAAPSPLYPVYQQLWGFSPFVLTVIFAVYVAALLGSLLTAGSLSDLIGRRPVVIGGLVLLAAAMLLFIAAHGVGGLIAARVLQGLATGVITGTTNAMIVDFQPGRRIGSMVTGAAPALGMAVGALLSGVLVQWAPWPRFLIFWVLFGIDLVLAGLLLLVPESSARRGPVGRQELLRSLRPTAGLDPVTRPVFAVQMPALAATWALGGLYLSLGSSIASRLLGVSGHAGVGAVLACFFASAVVATPVFNGLPLRARRPLGYAALAAGVLLTVLAATLGSLPLDVLGSVIAGFGWGGTFLVAMGAIAAATPGERRAQTFASVYIASYIAFSVPALIAGLAVQLVGMRSTVIAYGAFDLLLIMVATVAAVLRSRRPAAEPTVEPAMTCPASVGE